MGMVVGKVCHCPRTLACPTAVEAARRENDERMTNCRTRMEKVQQRSKRRPAIEEFLARAAGRYCMQRLLVMPVIVGFEPLGIANPAKNSLLKPRYRAAVAFPS